MPRPSPRVGKPRGHYVNRARLVERRLELKADVPDSWTQEDLAERAEVSVRTIQRMETEHIRFALKTIKQVAYAIELPPDEIIVPENTTFIRLRAPEGVDFRCFDFPEPNEEKWKDSALLISMLPIFVELDPASPDSVELLRASISSDFISGGLRYNAYWLVGLHPGASNWRGVRDNFTPVVLAPGERFISEVMFYAESAHGPTWNEFISDLTKSSEPLIELDLRLEFDVDDFDLRLRISAADLRKLVPIGRRNRFGFPRYLVPDVLECLNHDSL